jgi:hypothetical protein
MTEADLTRWNANREKLEQEIVDATKALLEHTGGAFLVPVAGDIIVVGGSRKDVKSLLGEQTPSLPTLETRR